MKQVFFITYIRCDVKTMWYIVFISHSLHWRHIKIALQEYVIMLYIFLYISGYIVNFAWCCCQIVYVAHGGNKRLSCQNFGSVSNVSVKFISHRFLC